MAFLLLLVKVKKLHRKNWIERSIKNLIELNVKNLIELNVKNLIELNVKNWIELNVKNWIELQIKKTKNRKNTVDQMKCQLPLNTSWRRSLCIRQQKNCFLK